MRLFDDFGHELEETTSVLLGFNGRNAVHVRSILDRFGCFGRLLLDAVVREDVDQCQEVDLSPRTVCELNTKEKRHQTVQTPSALNEMAIRIVLRMEDH